MTNPSLTLRELTEQDEAAFFEGLKEWAGEDLTWYTFDWKPGVAYADMLQSLRDKAVGINLAQGHVPGTMLYAFVEGKIVGRVSIRHELNDYLRQRGGHIGYAVAPKFRGLGYATEMTRLSLDYCRARIGLKEILVTCADSNTPSWKIIEHFGGVLENKILDPANNTLVRRYWIKLF